MIRTVQYNDRTFSYTLTNKKVKNINLRIRADGSIAVSAPLRMPAKRVDTFVLSKADWITRILDVHSATPAEPFTCSDGDTVWLLGEKLTLHVAPGAASLEKSGELLVLCVPEPENPAARRAAFDKLIRATAVTVLAEYARQAAALFASRGIAPPQFRFRSMTARWGSCQPVTRVITLNVRVIHVPPAYIEYVLAHEFCHFFYANHSPDFYRELARYQPDWKQLRTGLNKLWGPRCFYRPGESW